MIKDGPPTRVLGVRVAPMGATADSRQAIVGKRWAAIVGDGLLWHGISNECIRGSAGWS